MENPRLSNGSKMTITSAVSHQSPCDTLSGTSKKEKEKAEDAEDQAGCFTHYKTVVSDHDSLYVNDRNPSQPSNATASVPTRKNRLIYPIAVAGYKFFDTVKTGALIGSAGCGFFGACAGALMGTAGGSLGLVLADKLNQIQQNDHDAMLGYLRRIERYATLAVGIPTAIGGGIVGAACCFIPGVVRSVSYSPFDIWQAISSDSLSTQDALNHYSTDTAEFVNSIFTPIARDALYGPFEVNPEQALKLLEFDSKMIAKTGLTRKAIGSHYRRVSQKYHSDRDGGSDGTFQVLVQSRDTLEKAVDGGMYLPKGQKKKYWIV